MYVQGYIATITVDGTAHHPDASTATLTQTKVVIEKTKLGQRRKTKLSGLEDATIEMNLHANTATVVALENAYHSIDPVAVVFRRGELGDTDLGQYDGEGIISDYSSPGDAEGEWEVSLTIEMTGDMTFTPPI